MKGHEPGVGGRENEGVWLIWKSLTIVFIAVLFITPSVAFAAPVVCECVRFLREQAGVDIRGDAVTLRPNLPLLNIDIGHVLLTRYRKVHHASLVIGFVWEEGRQLPTHIQVLEANYKRCQVGTRLIPYDDPSIKGVLKV